MAGNNPVFNNIQKQLQGGEYAGIGEPRGAQQRTHPARGVSGLHVLSRADGLGRMRL